MLAFRGIEKPWPLRAASDGCVDREQANALRVPCQGPGISLTLSMTFFLPFWLSPETFFFFALVSNCKPYCFGYLPGLFIVETCSKVPVASCWRYLYALAHNGTTPCSISQRHLSFTPACQSGFRAPNPFSKLLFFIKRATHLIVNQKGVYSSPKIGFNARRCVTPR